MAKKQMQEGYFEKEPSYEGERFRVRDKDHRNGSPVIVWGSDLTREEADRLKERVCGTEKSTTARVESMSEPLPATAVNPKGQPLSNTPPRGLPSPRGFAGQRPSSVVTPGAPLHADPKIASVQQKAMAAARAPAAKAQERADNLIALPQHPQHAHPNDQLPFAPEVPEAGPLDLPEGIEGELDELLEGPESDPASM